MSRILTVILIFLLGVVAALLVLGYFAYVIRTGPPEEALLAKLEAPVEVSFADQGTASVRATSLEDAIAGLGYAQAATRTWPLIVYRAAATASLLALGDPADVAADELAIQLRIGASAEEAYAMLAESDRRLLEAFARGVNTGLSSESITRDPSLVLSGHVPEPWLPWHTIAVERLFGWLAASGAAHTDFGPLSRPIRDALRLHDFGESAIITSEWPAEPGLFVRYVWGSTALPVLFEATLDFGQPYPLRGACLIGTPFFVAARNGGRAWAYLPEQEIEERTVLIDSVSIERNHVVLTLPDGTEKLVTLLKAGPGVALGESDPDEAGASIRTILWPGLGPVTDTASWLGLLRGQPPTFELLRGHGVELSEDVESARAVGESRPLVGGRMLGGLDFHEYAAQRIDTLMMSSPSFNPRLWFTDTYSPWAARWAPTTVDELEAADLDATEREALSYLRNWDFSFDQASIAASIFHAWAREFRVMHGSWPGLDPTFSRLLEADSLGLRPDLLGPFELAVADLIRLYGPDLSLWRWEDVGAVQIYLPILGRPPVEPGGRELSRYSPRTVPGNGHPSTPNWYPATTADRVVPASIWEGWTRLTVRDEWTVRRWHPDVTKSLGSGRAPDESSSIASLGDSGRRWTRLVPVPLNR